jgi:hypothetical protein
VSIEILVSKMAKNKKYIKRAYSKSPLRGFVWNNDVSTVFPDFSFSAVIGMIDNDPVARGAITHFVDKAMEGDYSVIKRDTFDLDKEEELRLQEKYQFRTEILRKIFLMGKLFNNVFIEIVKDTKGHTKSLNILDSMNVDAITEPNGDAKSYKSKIPDPTTGTYPTWTKEEIVWLKFGDRTTGFAPVDMKALWENLCAKEYVKRYVAWLWETGQYRLIHNVKNASDKDIEDFMAYGRKNDRNFKSPFIIKGDYEAKVLRDIKETESITTLLKYYDSQTLILLRIPPIDAGIPDASGRSNADAQSNNLSTTIKSFKKLIEDKVNFDLFPKINKSNSLIKFGPTDRFAESEVFKNIQIMQSMNMTDEAIEEYLEDKGMYLSSKLFKDPMEMMQTLPSINPRDKDTAPSRSGNTTKMGQESKGSGEASSTREDQLRS